MWDRGKHWKLRAGVVGAASSLFALLRARRLRNRNRAELRKLDESRLQDIGLTEQMRSSLAGGEPCDFRI